MISIFAWGSAPGPFDPAVDVGVVYSQGAVVLTPPAGAHLKRRFLGVTLGSAGGSINAGPFPEPDGKDDAGDPVYRGPVRIPVAGEGLAGDVDLDVRYQPCTEGPRGVCYLPLTRRLRVPADQIPQGAGSAGAVPAPEAGAAEDLDGRPFSLASVRGSVAVVDFWASWCGPCRRSFPALEKLHAAHASEGLKVVGVSLDEDRLALFRFLESTPVTFRIAWDRSGSLARQWRVASMPTTVILDREGNEVARFEGGGRVSEEERAVAALLSGKALPPGAGARVAAGSRATGSLKAWERGHLADPMMSLDGDPLEKSLREHLHSAKEGAAGNGGAAGGGCGCN